MHSWADDDLYEWASVHRGQQLDTGTAPRAERLAGWQERYPDVVADRRLVYGDAGEKLVDASESRW